MNLQTKYSSEAIINASQFEREELLANFQQEYISIPKFLGFVAYNFCGLAGLAAYGGWYVKSRHLKKGQPRTMRAKDLTLWKLVKGGSKISLLLGSLYMGGFIAYVNYAMPLNVFLKYAELKERANIFQIKFNPYYQQLMLFSKMRESGLSQNIIQNTKADLDRQKHEMIVGNKLKKDTIQKILKAEEYHKLLKDKQLH